MKCFQQWNFGNYTKASLYIYLLFTSPVHAQIRYDPPTVTVSGKIDSSAYEKLSDIFSKESVSTVIFKNSGGGSFEAGLQIGKLISGKKIKTVVEGICASACAIAFLGGDLREFSSEQPDSALMFHPGFARTSNVPAQETKAIFFAWFQLRTMHPPSSEIIAAMDKITGRKGGVYFLSPSHGTAIRTGASVFFCDGSEAGISNCRVEGTSTADKMFITSAATPH